MFNVLTVEGHDYTDLEKNMLGTMPLLVTNFCATAVIAYKAWYVDCDPNPVVDEFQIIWSIH